MKQLIWFSILFACLEFIRPAPAQDAVPGEILSRTILLKGATQQGTAFAIDHKGKIYFITARHIVAGMPTTNATFSVRKKGEWLDVSVPKIIFPESDAVDMAILVTGENAAQPYGITSEGSTGGATMGQQVWFLGYPFIEGLSSQGQGWEAPFIKRGTMSAIVSTDPKAVILYIDGFNNHGFSGGPIVYWDFTDRRYKIIGVVQGFKNDSAIALIDGKQVDTNILVNSGILVGYSIAHAIEAIDKELAAK